MSTKKYTHEPIRSRSSRSSSSSLWVCNMRSWCCIFFLVCCPNTATSVCVRFSEIEHFIESVFHLILFGMQFADCLTKVSFPFTCYLPLAHPLTSALSLSLCTFLLPVCRRIRLSMCVICASDSRCIESCNFCQNAHCPFLRFHSKLCTTAHEIGRLSSCCFFIAIAPISYAVAHSPNFYMFSYHQLRKNRVIARI